MRTRSKRILSLLTVSLFVLASSACLLTGDALAGKGGKAKPGGGGGGGEEPLAGTIWKIQADTRSHGKDVVEPKG